MAWKGKLTRELHIHVNINSSNYYKLQQHPPCSVPPPCLHSSTCVHCQKNSRVIDEDEQKAFLMFEKAAKDGHVGAMYMTADCLLTGVRSSLSCYEMFLVWKSVCEKCAMRGCEKLCANVRKIASQNIKVEN